MSVLEEHRTGGGGHLAQPCSCTAEKQKEVEKLQARCVTTLQSSDDLIETWGECAKQAARGVKTLFTSGSRAPLTPKLQHKKRRCSC